MIEVVPEAYRAVFGQLNLFLDLAWLPLLLQLAATVCPPLAQHFFPSTIPVLSNDLLAYAEAATGIVFVNAFGVRWYAALLFADGRAMPRAHFLKAWGRFVGYGIIFAIPSLAVLDLSPEKLVAQSDPAITASIQNTVVAALLTASVAVILVISLALARWSLLFPAAAYGRPLGWREAWRGMRGNTWRYVGCLLLTSLPLLIFVLYFEKIVLSLAGLNDQDAIKKAMQTIPGAILLDGLCDTIVMFVGFALAASILAGFYRRLVLHRPT
jgi:hypothetical protein